MSAPPYTPYAQSDLLALFDRILPDFYLDPLKNVGPGYELLQAFAQIGARVSTAIVNLDLDNIIATSTGPSFSTVQVQFSRGSATPTVVQTQTTNVSFGNPFLGIQTVSGLLNMNAASVGHLLRIAGAVNAGNNGTFQILGVNSSTSVFVSNPAGVLEGPTLLTWSELYPNVVVKAGTVVKTSSQNRRFLTTQDAVFAPTAVGPITVNAVAVSPGYEWNVRGQRIAADGTILPGEIDTVEYFIQDPPFGDPTITVSQIPDAIGGHPPMLDQLGADRGIPRITGESDVAYRKRIQQLPDTVSPDAIKRALSAFFAPFGATATFIETWQHNFDEAWSGIAVDSQIVAVGGFDPTIFVYNDTRPVPPFQDRWLSETTFRGCFIIIVPNLSWFKEFGFVYNDPGLIPSDFFAATTGGRRTESAFNVPDSAASATFLLPAYNGASTNTDMARSAVFQSLIDLLSKIKAAGVTVFLEPFGQ